MKVKFNHWLPKFLKVNGIVLYPYVLLAPEKPIKFDKEVYILLKHEMTHVAQIRREFTPLFFYIKYLWRIFKRIGLGLDNAYWLNEYEQEAYALENTALTLEEKVELDQDWI